MGPTSSVNDDDCSRGCSVRDYFDIAAVCLFLSVQWWQSAAGGERDARLCQWGGVNVHRLAIQPLIHNRGRSLH